MAVRSPKNFVILFLGFAFTACAMLAWRQHQELLALRAVNSADRVPTPSHVAQTERPPADTPAAPVNADEEDDHAPETGAAQSAPNRTWSRSADRRRFAAVMENPEIQRLMTLQHKAALDGRYAALFRALKLTPEQLEKFKNLLVERSSAVVDVAAAAREQGITRRSDREAFDKLVADAQAEIDANIRATLGETGFSDYKKYEQTMPQRSVVNQLEQRLSYSSTPLTPQQTAQVVDILAATAPRNDGGANVTFGSGPGGGPVGRVPITDAAIQQSLGVLAAPQIEALRQLQQEQQAQAALGAAMRQQFQERRASGTPGD
ncbi:MAG TPA: hypothetical protein VNR00_03430 [Opitutus sp.]|nr:hypothetical protein [Opitutus sp.]